MLVFCMLLSLTACGGRTDVGEGDSYIYGLNTERTGLVKAAFDISQEDTEAAGRGSARGAEKVAGGDRVYGSHP